MAPPKNGLSFDFEDWYRPFAARSLSGWERFPSRVPRDTERLLTLLGRAKITCTFFVVGEVAEAFPEQILALHRAGHEIASHGHRHEPLYRQEPARFEDETHRSIEFLKRLTGQAVVGFRAPFFSLREDSLWAIDSLHRLGLTYDSSIHPTPTAGILHGYRRGGRLPYYHHNGLREIPVTTYPVAGVALPFGGGVYFRLLPYWVIRAGVQRLNGRDVGCNLYFHPRELDPDLPRVKSGLFVKVIVYAGVRAFEAKLDRAFEDFDFVPLRDLPRGDSPGPRTP